MSRSNHHRLVEGFDAHVAAHLSKPIYSETIALKLDVSIRTLHNAVVKVTGMSPHRYIRSIRLKAAHAALANGSGDTVIKVIARDCGFHHMGEFSKAYFQQFGELPSDTTLAARRAHLAQTAEVCTPGILQPTTTLDQ